MRQMLLLARYLSLDFWKGAPSVLAGCQQSSAAQSLWQVKTYSFSTTATASTSTTSTLTSRLGPTALSEASLTSQATSSDSMRSPDSTSASVTTSISAPSSSAGEMAYGARQLIRKVRGQEALHGIVHINNTMNNILMALTDVQGNIKISRSAGNLGFRNARKSLPAAAERTAEAVAQGALKLGYGSVVVKLKGVGPHKNLAVQMLHACGLRITELQDVTPIAYNGCRLPKRRRI